ncbi:helix-turn-helix domain-containing protein [Nocardia higoensis]|uniref:Helix-turn-helix domain-containing protein n=1 Tax=Nocardia higoensis TaxID=228599 RepID=A0ABS0D625_9NOCA|nr:helix-turn-helix domain-containing protein [Nocardia higoensis]
MRAEHKGSRAIHLRRSTVDRSPSPPTRRVLDVLTLLADAREALPVAAVADRLGLARATVTAILAELDEAGWAQRDAGRRYRLGPAPAALFGGPPPDGPPDAAIADALATLVARTGAGATLSRVDSSGLTVLAVRHGPDRAIAGVPLGHRIPVHYPAGAAVLPWRPGAELRRWLAGAPDAERTNAAALPALVRERGVAVFGPRPEDANTVELLADLLTALGPEMLEPHLRTRTLRRLSELTARPYTAADLDSPDPLPVSYLAAPVFDQGVATHEVQSGPLRSAATRAERDEYVAATIAAAQQISAAFAS